MRVKITKRVVDALVPDDTVSDTEVKGFIARRLPSGTVTYGYRYRDRGSRQRWLPLGLHGSITPDQARELAKQRAGEVASGRDPGLERAEGRTAAASTVDALLDDFLVRHVRGKLRSANEIERTFDVYVRPRLGGKSIYNLRRSDIVELLDQIEDKNGPVMADRALAYVRKAFNWQATRDDSFTPPIVRGMARTKPSERKRTRFLDDLRCSVSSLNKWRLTGRGPPFVYVGHLVRYRPADLNAYIAARTVTSTSAKIPLAMNPARRDLVEPTSKERTASLCPTQ